ncbi:MAG TPA: 2-ketoarginine methyltransferase [Hyalangium sp.]|jgi:2-ketoarginine methyltransferase|nr:2-ketoarginine methyltransferase [Hyalangium sp.]
METLEPRLIEALQPIRQYVIATAVYHLFDTGLFDALSRPEAVPLRELCERHHFDSVKLEALLKFLRNEGYVVEQESRYALSAKGRALADFRGWYTMMIGGYGNTFLQLGKKLDRDGGWATRDGEKVGVGSCGISHYDAIPLTRRLMEKVPHGRRMLDLGCGNGLYLVEFCKAMPHIEAWGVEPHPEGYKAAVELVRRHELEHRIQLTCSSAVEFLASPFEWNPDFVVLGFVLHEVLAQEGEAAVIELLDRLTQRFPELNLIVIEVDYRIDDPRAMQHGLSLAYYNSYYLLHPFTRQRLETEPFWDRLFERGHLEIVAKDRVSADVDSTGLTIGYLLRRRK